MVDDWNWRVGKRCWRDGVDGEGDIWDWSRVVKTVDSNKCAGEGKGDIGAGRAGRVEGKIVVGLCIGRGSSCRVPRASILN